MRNMTLPLSRQRLVALCRPAAHGVAIRLVAETGSTNADLLAVLDDLTAPTLLIAESQSAGRGRSGRTWLSAPGASLTFSLAWRFKLPVHGLIGLPLAIGVVIAEALAPFGVEARLKWPNDVLMEGRKLAGILIETAAAKSAAGEATWAVIGIGLNLALPAGMAAQIAYPVADLAQVQIEREALMAALLNGLAEALPQFEGESFKPFVGRWNALHAYAGQPVCVLEHGQVLHEGKAVGVDQIGRLVLDTAVGRIAVMAGDVSLRAKED